MSWREQMSMRGVLHDPLRPRQLGLRWPSTCRRGGIGGVPQRRSAGEGALRTRARSTAPSSV